MILLLQMKTISGFQDSKVGIQGKMYTVAYEKKK